MVLHLYEITHNFLSCFSTWNDDWIAASLGCHFIRCAVHLNGYKWLRKCITFVLQISKSFLFGFNFNYQFKLKQFLHRFIEVWVCSDYISTNLLRRKHLQKYEKIGDIISKLSCMRSLFMFNIENMMQLLTVMCPIINQSVRFNTFVFVFFLEFQWNLKILNQMINFESNKTILCNAHACGIGFRCIKKTLYSYQNHWMSEEIWEMFLDFSFILHHHLRSKRPRCVQLFFDNRNIFTGNNQRFQQIDVGLSIIIFDS